MVLRSAREWCSRTVASTGSRARFGTALGVAILRSVVRIQDGDADVPLAEVVVVTATGGAGRAADGLA